MPEESTETDPKTDEAAIKEVVGNEPAASSVNEDAEEDEAAEGTNPDNVAKGSATKKKKSKKAKLKKALGVDSSQDAEASSSSKPASKFTNDMVEQLLKMNPSLKSEVTDMDKNNAADTVRKMDMADLVTGLVGRATYIVYRV